MPIEMQEVNSSNIALAGYDEETQVLDIEFTNGKRYSYDGVPKHVADGLFQAESAGKYFYSEIRNRYRYYPA